MLRDVQREAGLAHPRPAGEDDEVAPVETMGHLVEVDETGLQADQRLVGTFLDDLERLVGDAGERHEPPLERLLAQGEDRLLGPSERPLRVEPAVEAVPGDVATDLDQAPSHRPLLDDLDVGLDPSEIVQIDVEGREVGEPAGLLQLRRLLQRRLQGADVGRDLLFLQVEHRPIDEPVALVVEVVDRQPGRDRRQQPRVEQRRGEHGALGLFALRQRRLGGEALDHRRRGR